jgi:hypothetical protein
MSAVLRKRVIRREEALHAQFLAAVLPATILLLSLVILLGLVGHFFPAH